MIRIIDCPEKVAKSPILVTYDEMCRFAGIYQTYSSEKSLYFGSFMVVVNCSPDPLLFYYSRCFKSIDKPANAWKRCYFEYLPHAKLVFDIKV